MNYKNLLPPIILNALKELKTPRYGWFGDYKNWEEALAFCSGYDSEDYFLKLKIAAEAVRNGKAFYDRDTKLFYAKEYNLGLVAILLYIYSIENNLYLLDYGGALGSTYTQNRDLIKNIKIINWNIVEQKQIVDLGKKYFENSTLNFFYNVDDVLTDKPITTVLLSGILQYLPNSLDIIKKLNNYKIKYLILERVSITDSDDIITVQKVDPALYSASYPCWFFNEEKLISSFNENGYHLFYKYSSEFSKPVSIVGQNKGIHQNYVFVRKQE